jgi:hypothetical protein
LLQALLALGLGGCSTRVPGADPTGRPAPEAAGATAAPDPVPSAVPATPPAPAPAPSPAATPTPAVGGRTLPVVSRDLLGLPDPAGGGRQHTITGLMLHHTAAPTTDAASAPARFRGHARAHREAGFVDIAYHYGVDVAGTVYELRDPSIAGETFTDYDPAGWLLVVCEGNFEESAPTDAMLAAVADVFAAGAARFGVDPATLVGHRDRAATLCPGANLQARLVGLEAQVRERLAAGGVTLALRDDPDLLPD